MARGKPRPGQLLPPALVYALAAKVLKRVKVTTRGTEQQVPAKRQNRGSRNSTGDGLKKQNRGKQ
ncbi:TPA: hypothetical protein ACJGVM_003722 [Salmonella enterica subsp. enterica serovar Welikade]|nr:hypothetical protein [Salmonella enterica subsp. enterica]EAY8717661.1 hypothetical protein [Salmonella enterica]ECI2267486.1 hypothetical protein [Salmonella enterica subsp. enterica serovar Wandsworth]EDQ3255636.1 hypothetical protein [Salmonella enterica subsp. enterica serovar Farmsen]EBA3920908.1 hypothetical protein [Salmonella enterica]